MISTLDVSRLGLGANTFGWTADRDAAFAVLDAYVDAGGNFVDTADSYGRQSFVGASETIIGEWFAARGRRDDVVLATKVGSLAQPSRALGREHHRRRRRVAAPPADRPHRPLLGPQGRPRHPAGGDARRVRRARAGGQGARDRGVQLLGRRGCASALAISAREGLAAYVALQPHYNLMERAEFETALLPVLAEHGLSCVPYFGLARGFLTGKYRPGRRGRQPAGRGRAAPTSTSAGSRCSPCSTRWRRRTACRWPPSRWPGSPRSRRWRRRWPARGRSISCADLLPDALARR